ncbi:MAG TPA: HAD family hydrolase [Candidatus Saccharimonadales bacterium]|nr:HAD family hydrolase [Candidatus Saccharimonadales bacterium]
MKIENVKGVIWDLDGTLLDSFGIFEQIIAEVVQESGHTMPTHEYMLNNFHGSLEETVQQVLGIESAEELDGIISSFLKKQEKHYAGDLEAHLFKDASMLAQRAAKQGIQQLLVTNRTHQGRGNASPRNIIEATVLADCIHEIRPGDEVDYRKPDKRSVGDWMKKHKIAANEVVVIGDQFIDAQLAINLGARVILIKRHSDIPHLNTLTNKNKGDIVIVETLEEIILND